ncbi:MAG: hypothetical protein HYU69_06455 [Bacteroidetes bacterium]|nr:hypothetical protein [Bacteroidota bacterium]
MKILALFATLVFIAPIVIYSQDTIVKKDGQIFLCTIQNEDSVKVDFIFNKDGKKILGFINKSDIQSLKRGVPEKEPELFFDKAAIGLGVGLDLGGIGANVLVYPGRKNLGFFAGTGYAIAGVGFNAGIKFRIKFNKDFAVAVPYVLAMYGYNAAITVKNAESYNRVFYGPSFGLGIDIRSKPSGKRYVSLSFIVPVRNSDVYDYINYLKSNSPVVFKNQLMPVVLSIGYRIIVF